MSITPFSDAVPESHKPHISALALFLTFSRITLSAFGGLQFGARRALVERQRWLTGVIEYLLFAFPPVAQRFNHDEMVIVPPDGIIRRIIGATNGAILMKQAFWAPIVAKWKEDYPHRFDGSDEESADNVSSDESSPEPAT